jgi:hypothetical protein
MSGKEEPRKIRKRRHNIETDEEDNTSKESRPESLERGGGDEVNQEEGGEEGENKDKGKVTPPKDPPTEAETLKKRKVYPQKPSTIKNTRANKSQSKNVLTEDDVGLIIVAMEDA